MEEIYIVKGALKKDRKKERKRKYRECDYCSKLISKKNYSKHIYRMHLEKVSKEKQIMIAAKLFIKNTESIINDLSELKILLNEVIKIKVNKKKMMKRLWYRTYKKGIKELTKLLQKKSNNNKEEENYNNDGEGEGEGEENNNNDDDAKMDID